MTLPLVLGAVRSILIPLMLALLVLPAKSVIDTVVESEFPSPTMMPLAGHALAKPEVASPQAHWIVMSLLYQPEAFGLDVGIPLIVGGVVSILIVAV